MFATGTARAASAAGSGTRGLPYPSGVTDTSHCTPEAAEIFRGFFTAKSEHNLTALMSYFSTANITYIDACLGVSLPSWEAVDSTFASAFASAPASAISSCASPSCGWGQLTLTASLPRSARAWTGNGTPREPRSLKHRPEGAIRTVPIPPQLARLLRWHLRDFGCAADGRLFQGARGGPLSESRYGRIWHQARTAAIPEDGTGTLPARRPYDLRHAALSLWLASGAPPAEIAARAGHSVRVLLTIYAHGMPRLRPARQPAHRASPPPQPMAPIWPTKIRADAGNPVRHASVPQLDSTGHSWT